MEKELPKLRIKEILKEKGISQIELAEKMGKSKQYISNIVTGGKGMSIATLVEIAKIWMLNFAICSPLPGIIRRLMAILKFKMIFTKFEVTKTLRKS